MRMEQHILLVQTSSLNLLIQSIEDQDTVHVLVHDCFVFVVSALKIVILLSETDVLLQQCVTKVVKLHFKGLSQLILGSFDFR